MVLQLPVQNAPIPQSVKDLAQKLKIQIMDEDGLILYDPLSPH